MWPAPEERMTFSLISKCCRVWLLRPVPASFTVLLLKQSALNYRHLQCWEGNKIPIPCRCLVSMATVILLLTESFFVCGPTAVSHIYIYIFLTMLRPLFRLMSTNIGTWWNNDSLNMVHKVNYIINRACDMLLFSCFGTQCNWVE